MNDLLDCKYCCMEAVVFIMIRGVWVPTLCEENGEQSVHPPSPSSDQGLVSLYTLFSISECVRDSRESCLLSWFGLVQSGLRRWAFSSECSTLCRHPLRFLGTTDSHNWFDLNPDNGMDPFKLFLRSDRVIRAALQHTVKYAIYRSIYILYWTEHSVPFQAP